ncbi:MAG: DnaJ domain-containing protein [Alphaproteobacteria bacterium]|nr:DnaJ domain-containing protein [Alphaproteobacteria bacterium]
MTVVTHYDTLKITRDAPPEVIQAVYKALAQKYHPDKNLNNPEAVRMMQMVITSYKTLSDDARRKEHDDWVNKQLPPPPKRALTPQEKAAEEKAATYAEAAAKWNSWAVSTGLEAKAARDKATQAATKAATCPPSEKQKWAALAQQTENDAVEAEKKAAAAAVSAKQSTDEAAKHAVASKDGAVVTLYDTLKILRDAPPEVIAAAARAMGQKFPNDPAVSKAIEHLSDAQKKAAHDAWIREKDPVAGGPRKSTAQEIEARTRAEKASNEAKAKAAMKDGPAWKTWAEKAQKEAEQERARAKIAAQKAADARQRAETAFRELQSSSAAAERDEAMWTSSTNMATD